MERIHEALAEGKFPNCTTLAKRLEVATKTVQRDIDFMRDRFSLPIEFDAIRNGYRYTEPVENLPLVQTTEGELVAMLVAQKAIEQYKGTAFEEPLTHAFARIVNRLDGPVTVVLGEARKAITFRPAGVGMADLALFRRLSEAVLHANEIEFDYRSLREGEPEKRRIQPWHLCCVDNQWYVIGLDLVRNATRTFAVPRIRRVKLLKKRFARPADFSIQKHLGGTFGVFTGTGDHRIRLRFRDWAARYVNERFWHESQRLTEGGGGSVVMELRLNSLVEVQRWILGFGEHIEVIKPAELRASVAEAGRRIAARNA